MITLRGDRRRRHVRRVGQDIWHTFSPEKNTERPPDGFGALAVLDEVGLRPGPGTAPHRDGEADTLTYVGEGALAQEDSLIFRQQSSP